MAELKFVDLTVDNLFDCCTMIDAIGADQILAAFNKDEITALTESGKGIQGVGLVIGMKICGIVIKNLPKARNEVYMFFANCCIWDNGTVVTTDEIRNMKIGQFTRLIKDFFKRDDLGDFFKEVAEFLGSAQNDSGKSSIEDTGIRMVT